MTCASVSFLVHSVPPNLSSTPEIGGAIGGATRIILPGGEEQSPRDLDVEPLPTGTRVDPGGVRLVVDRWDAADALQAHQQGQHERHEGCVRTAHRDVARAAVKRHLERACA